ncbi:MAG TPA: tetratricopeptide repeat protein, partial [Chitinophagaceae bacterium]|nr:tetratricopeptide repeat protein [Chitinophagaceae bacterium]
PTVSAGSVSPTISDQPGLTQQQFLDFKKAKQLMSNGDYAEAARLLEKVKNPDYPNAFLENMLIQCYTKIGDYVAAAEEQKILAKVGKYAGKIATASIQQTSKANNRIMETDSVAYAAARKTNTIEAYQNYLNSKYHSRYAKSARTMIDYLNYENAQRENTESSYTKYLNNFPNGEYASDAKNDINRLVKTSNDYYWNQYYNARYARNYSIRRMVITETIGLGALAVGVNATVNGDPNSDLQVITQILGFVIGGGAVIGGFAGIGYINDQSSLMERSKNKIRPLPYSVSFRASPSLYCYRNHYTPALSLTIGF